MRKLSKLGKNSELMPVGMPAIFYGSWIVDFSNIQLRQL
jgi:hypothetical protein